MELNELEALQNACNQIDGLEAHKVFNQDKRKKVNKYYLTLNGTTLSGQMLYMECNMFILGFVKGYYF